MFQYLLLGLAAVTVMNVSWLESLAASDRVVDYVVAIAVALMLKPWLEAHFE